MVSVSNYNSLGAVGFLGKPEIKNGKMRYLGFIVFLCGLSVQDVFCVFNSE